MSRKLGSMVLALGVMTALAVGLGIRPAAAQPVTASSTGENTRPAMATPPQQIPEVGEAVKLFQTRAFDKCEEKLEGAVAKHPELPPAPILMAQLFAQANLPAMVRTALEKAAIKAPDDPEAFVIMGEFAVQDHRVTDAALLFAKSQDMLKAFDKPAAAKRKENLNSRVLSGLAAVAEARGEWSVAQSYLEKLQASLPEKATGSEKASVLQRQARAYFQQKKAKESLAKLRSAFAEDKANMLLPEAILARFYEEYGDPQNAKTWMDHAVQKDPDGLRTRLVAAEWALGRGDTKRALAEATKALSIDSGSLEAKIICGIVALFNKDYAKAEEHFQDAHLQSPSNFAAVNNLALALCEQRDAGKKRKAIEYAENNLKQNQQTQQTAEAASTLGWVYYRNEMLNQADQALRIAARSGNLSPDTAYYIAQVQADLGNKADAKTLVKAALQSSRPFSMRPEAQALSDKLEKAASSTP
jgi:tetratricopeptide (TPR) repeat protein